MGQNLSDLTRGSLYRFNSWLGPYPLQDLCKNLLGSVHLVIGSRAAKIFKQRIRKMGSGFTGFHQWKSLGLKLNALLLLDIFFLCREIFCWPHEELGLEWATQQTCQSFLSSSFAAYRSTSTTENSPRLLFEKLALCTFANC